MVSDDSRAEMEEMLGLVPEFVEEIADPASDHGWGLLRDLELGDETELTGREKALIGVGVASALQCPYCVHFHTEEAKVDGATETEIGEAASLAANTRYFSTVIHGSGIDYDEFVRETADIVEHVERAQAEAGAD